MVAVRRVEPRGTPPVQRTGQACPPASSGIPPVISPRHLADNGSSFYWTPPWRCFMRSLSKKVMLSAAVGGALVLGAQTAMARPDARSLREVDTIWVDSNVCTADIEDRLRDRGFFVTNSSRSADAHLVVDIFDRDSSRFDESARYSARMRGDDN